MTLNRAESLKATFAVSAFFYHAYVGEEKYLMRREAQIVRKGTNHEKADAIIVMLNPGSCKPTCEIGEGSLENRKMLSATPDQTQYQLMNLMERLHWNKLTIVNLSDICEGNSTRFRVIEQKFNLQSKPHSIFHSSNTNERNTLLRNANHLIFAWGETSTAKRLAKEFGLYDERKALSTYRDMKAVIHPTRYFPLHPKPALREARIAWLNNITPLLTGM